MTYIYESGMGKTPACFEKAANRRLGFVGGGADLADGNDQKRVLFYTAHSTGDHNGYSSAG